MVSVDLRRGKFEPPAATFEALLRGKEPFGLRGESGCEYFRLEGPVTAHALIEASKTLSFEVGIIMAPNLTLLTKGTRNSPYEVSEVQRLFGDSEISNWIHTHPFTDGFVVEFPSLADLYAQQHEAGCAVVVAGDFIREFRVPRNCHLNRDFDAWLVRGLKELGHDISIARDEVIEPSKTDLEHRAMAAFYRLDRREQDNVMARFYEEHPEFITQLSDEALEFKLQLSNG